MGTLTEMRPITSTKLGKLWLAYQRNRMMNKFLEYFIAKSVDTEAKNIMTTHYNNNNTELSDLERIFNTERAAIPTGFN